MDKQQFHERMESFLAAWNTGDAQTTAAEYSPEVRYSDPNTKSAINGREPLTRYFAKLFAAWVMRYEVRDAIPFADGKGGALLWRASLKPAGSEESAEVDGMDLIILKDGLVAVNEVYFDRSALTGFSGNK